jgi:DNA-directed RNA polymerase specialized sigma24 family protein
MDYSLLTDKARLLHRPTDADGLRAAAMELQAAGLTVTDIAQALGIGEGAVQQLLQAGEAP